MDDPRQAQERQLAGRAKLLAGCAVLVALVVLIAAIGVASTGGMPGGVAGVDLQPEDMSTGSGSAKMAPIDTPTPVRQAAERSSRLIASQVGAIASPPRVSSRTMAEDAAGTRFPGGEKYRETEFASTVLMGGPPFVAQVSGFTWGLPSGAYRLDVDTASAKSLAGRPTMPAGLDVPAVEADRGRLAGVFSDVLAAAGLAGRYDPVALARAAIVLPSWRGDGVVSVAALLPAMNADDGPGAIAIDLARDWRIESFGLDTTDDYHYRGVLTDAP